MGRREIVAFSIQKPLPKERPEKEDFSEGRENRENPAFIILTELKKGEHSAMWRYFLFFFGR